MKREQIIERLARSGMTGMAEAALEAAIEGHPAAVPTSGPDRGLKRAGVLVPLVNRPEGVTVLLTQRTAHLQKHAGQIAFPGGGWEPQDPDLVTTALRETEEEIGLPREHVEVLGRLGVYETTSAYAVTPVVGWIEPPFPLTIDPFEVAEAFEVPLSFILDPVNHTRESRVRDGLRRHFYVLPYEDRYIWGATAGMLVNLYDVLRD